MARAVAVATALLVVGCVGFIAMPLPGALLSREALSSLVITDRTGQALREVLSREDGRSVGLAGGRIPPLVRAAFIAAEDQRFSWHPGVDGVAVARAARDNVKAGRIVSGASTIPQQLARRLVPRERSWWGKAGEALWALRLTAHLPKDRVLLEYLDRVPLGNSTFGVEAAARRYFGRPAERLSAGQAALLAGMARSPARRDPFRRPDAAVAGMRGVLARMVEEGFLTAEEARLAEETPLDLTPAERVFEVPHLTTALLQRLPQLGLDGATRIETTIDPALQAAVEKAIIEELRGLAERRVGEAAAIVLDNATGEVLAYVGSSDFLDEAKGGQNDGVRSLRQPGSALKPFAYGLALSKGFTPSSVLADVEVHLATPGGSYVPKNYDRRVHGPVRLRAALASSYNIPAVRLTDALGPEQVLRVLREAGFESLTQSASHYGVGIVLGNGDVTLRELARAYRGLARGGVVGPVKEVRAAFGPDGAPLRIPVELEEHRFLAARPVELLTDVLADEAARAPAFGLDNALRMRFRVAAKTGTSRAHVDNWAAGFTRERTVAVWVGNFDGTPMRGVSGITGAGPVFARVMSLAMRGIRAAPLVDRSRFEAAAICPLSGERAGPNCPGALKEVYLPGTAPRHDCTMHRSDGALDVGPAYLAWAQAEGLASTSVGAQGRPGSRAGFILPADGDEFLVEPELPESAQAVPVRVMAPAGAKMLELRTEDGRRIELPPPFVTRLPAVAGERRLELWAPGGSEPLAVTRYRVR
ncbi:transglycosylase domain-containing protein [Corallococcus sp. BB11-1]|uniref:penicillin-binding protein 1C n=1 Tax=Corallococcus sp. BB11-1 TaxID=2996783 RepID=UPI0022708CB5|nr:transglycosylase domain-containing protein [Corallococcus sp. BB11-1]MCY1033858.1 transglycosylase domain-containing protein [Corallococcus sp. BB11-1]